MAKGPQNEASIPNPALKAFGVLVGEWNTVGTHPLVPGTTFHGHASFEWIEGGAFLIMHSEIHGEGRVIEGWGDVGRGSGANVYAGAVTDISQWLPFVPSTLTFRGAAHVAEACSW